MAVKGFNIGGSINRYDFNSLVNKEGAVTADMLGSDVTTQLTTMSSNISTLQNELAVQDITGRLTVSEGWTVHGRKCGKLVTLVFYTDTDQTLYNRYINFCTLPSDLRPAMYIRFTAFDNKATSANCVVAGNVNNSNGNVQIWPYYANTRPAGCVEFLVN